MIVAELAGCTSALELGPSEVNELASPPAAVVDPATTTCVLVPAPSWAEDVAAGAIEVVANTLDGLGVADGETLTLDDAGTAGALDVPGGAEPVDPGAAAALEDDGCVTELEDAGAGVDSVDDPAVDEFPVAAGGVGVPPPGEVGIVAATLPPPPGPPVEQRPSSPQTGAVLAQLEPSGQHTLVSGSKQWSSPHSTSPFGQHWLPCTQTSSISHLPPSEQQTSVSG